MLFTRLYPLESCIQDIRTALCLLLVILMIQLQCKDRLHRMCTFAVAIDTKMDANTFYIEIYRKMRTFLLGVNGPLRPVHIERTCLQKRPC